MTGGRLDEITNMDAMIRDTILIAAGIDTEYGNEVLKFVGYGPTNRIANLSSTEINVAENVLS